MSAAERWREQLAAWAIPPEILAAVPDSPWTVPTEVFARRADSSVAAPTAPPTSARGRPSSTAALCSTSAAARARRACVGCSDHGRRRQPDMLAALAARAQRLGLEARTIEGRWPDVAEETPAADVVGLPPRAYNVPDLGDFATALTDHARRRVVLELTPYHPMTPLNPLWTALHGIERPTGPTSRDAVDVLSEVGIEAELEKRPRSPRDPYPSFADMVAVTRRRLCLLPERDSRRCRGTARLGVDPERPRDLPPPEDTWSTLWWTP
jgi:hypothetical protein